MLKFSRSLLANPDIWALGAVVVMVAVPEQSRLHMVSTVVCLILILVSVIIIAFTLPRTSYGDRFWRDSVADCLLICFEFVLACIALYSAFMTDFDHQLAASSMLSLSKFLIAVIMMACAVAIGLVAHRMQSHQIAQRRF